MSTHEVDHISLFDSYQTKTHQFAVYPEDNALEYLALGLASEAGEAAGVVKKFIRGDMMESDMEEKLLKELGDTMWYISEIHNKLGDYLMSVTAAENINKLKSRQERNVLKGDGDVR